MNNLNFDFSKNPETGTMTCTFSSRVQLLYFSCVKTAIIVVDGERIKRSTPLTDIDAFMELQQEAAQINETLKHNSQPCKA